MSEPQPIDRIHAPASPAGAGIAYDSAAGRWVLAVAVLGSGMAFLDGTVVNVALPAIGRDLDASTASLQWILNGYLLTLASLILLGGSLGDRHGRRRVFVLGVVWFAAASLLCALAPSAAWLVAARALQGIGGALLTPGSLAMIESSFRPADRARAIGAWAGLTGVATAVGPLLGGYLVEAISWRAIFLINVPIGVLVVVAATRRVPETRDPRARGPLDVPGALLAAIGLAAATYALVAAPEAGASTAIVLAALAGAGALAAFIAVEHRSANPMMPLAIFASRQFRSANAITLAVYTALGGFAFLLVAFLQISLGYSPIAAGAASLPVTALMLTLSSRSGALAQRIGPRLQLSAGPLVIALGLLAMARISPGDGYVTVVLPAVVIFGIGLTLVVAPVTATVLAAVDDGSSGLASGINNAVARVGGLAAVAVLPLVGGLGGDRFYDPAAMTHGFHVAMVVAAGIAALGGIVAWRTIDPQILEDDGPDPPGAIEGASRARA